VIAPAQNALMRIHLHSFLAYVFAVCMAVLAGCASVPRTVEISQEQLQAALARRFPFNDRALQLLDVQAQAPRLQLLPESNRLRVDIALSASDRVVGRAMQGSLGLSFAPRYEPADASIRMADVRVERLDLLGLPQALQPQLHRLGPLLAERVLEGTALHTFKPDDVAKAQGWTPSDLRVTPAGLRVTLQPPAR
jgi:hypothetical protein